MRFKIDENPPVETAALLRQAGHDAETVQREALGGAPDTRVSTVARDERRVLVTLDFVSGTPASAKARANGARFDPRRPRIGATGRRSAPGARRVARRVA